MTEMDKLVLDGWDKVGQLVAKAEALEHIRKAVGDLKAENKRLRDIVQEVANMGGITLHGATEIVKRARKAL